MVFLLPPATDGIFIFYDKQPGYRMWDPASSTPPVMRVKGFMVAILDVKLTGQQGVLLKETI